VNRDYRITPPRLGKTSPSSHEGRITLERLAEHHGFSPEAARTLISTLIASNGARAQFNHTEFGGHGQWIRGAIAMTATETRGLRKRIDGLCVDLVRMLSAAPAISDLGVFRATKANIRTRRIHPTTEKSVGRNIHRTEFSVERNGIPFRGAYSMRDGVLTVRSQWGEKSARRGSYPAFIARSLLNDLLDAAEARGGLPGISGGTGQHLHPAQHPTASGSNRRSNGGTVIVDGTRAAD
jgi:hypothetical protein